MQGTRIAITGEGIICAIGNGKDAVMQSLTDGRSGIGEMCFLSSEHHELPVGEVKLSNEEMKAMLDIEPTQTVSRTVLLGAIAVEQALADAGIGCDGRKDVVLVSGTTVGGMDITEQYFDTFADSDEHIVCLRMHDCGSSTKSIASQTGLSDQSLTISTACSSAANAIIVGARLISEGKADIVVAGGTEALTRFHLNGFRSLMILDHERCRPFDDTRAGLNLGEGAAYVILESEASARKRGAVAHGWLAGYGNACDAYHQTASSDNGEGAYRAMREALVMAHLAPGDIDYVNAHGTGTPNNDQSESVALRRIFADRMPPVSSTKSLTGHTTSASGSIEAVICLLAMRHGFVPANLGWAHPMADGITPTAGKSGVTLRHVLCNAFGFGGNDSSLILSALPSCPWPSVLGDNSGDVQCMAEVEINDVSQLSELRRYVKPLEARRLCTLLKSALLASLKALEEAGIETPDAIITATSLGCLENSERLLVQMAEEGETMLKPTYFMQSTHNTIGSAIAIHTHCHGYNMTYTHGKESWELALRDACSLLQTGRAHHVLVGLHEEMTPFFRSLMERLGESPLPEIHSHVMVLSCGK